MADKLTYDILSNRNYLGRLLFRRTSDQNILVRIEGRSLGNEDEYKCIVPLEELIKLIADDELMLANMVNVLRTVTRLRSKLHVNILRTIVTGYLYLLEEEDNSVHEEIFDELFVAIARKYRSPSEGAALLAWCAEVLLEQSQS